MRDIDFGTMYKIIEFLYKGRVELDEGCVVDVLRAADIYGLDALKLKCETFLGDSLDMENVSKLLEISNIYSAWHLEKRCATWRVFFQVVFSSRPDQVQGVHSVQLRWTFCEGSGVQPLHGPLQPNAPLQGIPRHDVRRIHRPTCLPECAERCLLRPFAIS